MLVLAFMGVFLIIMGTISSYVLEQSKYGRALYAREQAFSIAESGIEYYRWFLAHNPSIMTSGSGLVSPYTYAVSDPEGGAVGSAAVTASASLQCGVVQWVDLSSKGTASAGVGFPRTVQARYMHPSVAEYAFLLNTGVWVGSGNVGAGPYFANGGIRSDGTNNSTVSSAVATWQCDSSYGCSPTQTKPGVWGAGNNQSLWQYPVASIDFAGIAANLNTLKTYAQTSGLYFYDSGVSGYEWSGFHLKFKSNGTVDVSKVTSTTSLWGYHPDDQQWHTDYDIIASETTPINYNIPANCSLIYVQGTTWLEGTVSGKVTVLTADPGSFSPDLLLMNNITYTIGDGTAGLTAIAEHSVRLPINTPDTLNIRGIFIAQSGYYGRDYHYPGFASGYDSYIIRSNLNVTGSIVSAARPYVYWTDGNGNIISGYQNRTNTYDRILAFGPPPFTPAASSDYKIELWNEK